MIYCNRNSLSVNQDIRTFGEALGISLTAIQVDAGRSTVTKANVWHRSEALVFGTLAKAEE